MTKAKAAMIREEEARAFAREAARILGSRTSAKKAAAARANGRLGGRPRTKLSRRNTHPAPGGQSGQEGNNEYEPARGHRTRAERGEQ